VALVLQRVVRHAWDPPLPRAWRPSGRQLLHALGDVGSRRAVRGGGEQGCHDNARPPRQDQLVGDDFLCELDYIGLGVFCGLVVATWAW
jgi:hypothetical protein